MKCCTIISVIDTIVGSSQIRFIGRSSRPPDDGCTRFHPIIIMSINNTCQPMQHPRTSAHGTFRLGD
eukprot:scaffold57386_cov66-Cyclotella_meneghiniana.AAC.3